MESPPTIDPPATRREAIRQRRRARPTRISVPANVSPHVRLVFQEMGRQRRTYDEIEEGSGVLRATLKAWRHKNRPGIDSIEAVLGFLGWTLVPVCRAKVLPKDLVADLDAVAKKHGLDESATIQTLIAHVTRIHERVPEAPPPMAPEIADMKLEPARGVGGTDTAAA